MADKSILCTTGITVEYCYSSKDKHGWAAKCFWYYSKANEDGCMQGEITTTFYEPSIEQAIDKVLNIMNMFGIKECNEFNTKFSLYGNELSEQSEEIKQIMRKEAERRGWKYSF